VIGVPPLSEGAAKVTVAVSSPRTAATVVGAPGIDAGIIELDGEDVVLPAELVAVALNLYVSPLVRPVITQLVAGAFTVQLFSGLMGVPVASVAITLYELTWPPDTRDGGVIVTVPA
jgi:predicted branched-subunit amino acid permease